MVEVSRRGLLGLFGGMGTAVAAGKNIAVAAPAASETVARAEALGEPSFSWARVELLNRALIGEIGYDRYESWFVAMNVEKYESGVLYVSVPVPFIKRWVDDYYKDKLVRAAQRVDGKIVDVRVSVRKPPITG